MQFIKARTNMEAQPAGIEGMLKHIELCGRVAYKSEDKITDTSWERFLKILTSRNHGSPLEHGTIYLTVPKNNKEFEKECNEVISSKYAEVVTDDDNTYITTNYRVVYKLNPDFITKFWSEPTKHVRRVTYRIICSRAIGYELVRHRVMSFTQESTRYCNYSKGKFQSCIQCIIPSWIDEIKDGETFTVADIAPDRLMQMLFNSKQHRSPITMSVISSHICVEASYFELLRQECTPQQARDVLPNGLKTELVITGTVPQWEHLLSLRSKAYGAVGAHPDMEVIADSIYYSLVSAGYIKERTKND